jgi:hypothetical protein
MYSKLTCAVVVAMVVLVVACVVVVVVAASGVVVVVVGIFAIHFQDGVPPSEFVVHTTQFPALPLSTVMPKQLDEAKHRTLHSATVTTSL